MLNMSYYIISTQYDPFLHHISTYLKNHTLSFRLLFLRDIPFLRTCMFSLFSAEAVYQNVCIDHRIIFDFW